MLGNRGVGTASINGGAFRGEGGPLHPQLVVPFTVRFDNFPSEAMIAIFRVKATLSSDQNSFSRNIMCRPAVEELIDNLPLRSFPTGTPTSSTDLRFWLSSAELENIERLRHESPADVFSMYVSVEAGIGWVKTFNQMGQEPLAGSPWDINHGMFSEVLPFWTCRITPIRVEIDQAHWIDRVLPGVGYDRLRLLELTFPPTLPDHSNAASQFDVARKALDQRRYGDCISACRGLLNMWEKQFGATRSNLVADVVKGDRGWPEGDIRRDLLDVLWREVGNVANAPHHPEGDVNAERFDGRDARLLLLLTAALSEYVESR
jgi:hypothetical protein